MWKQKLQEGMTGALIMKQYILMKERNLCVKILSKI